VGARLAERLHRSGETRPWGPQVRAVAGDIVERDWGLDADDLREVAAQADVIIHSAADTSFAIHRNTADTNIQSVERLVSLARACRHLPLVVYVSTAANVGDVCGCCLTEDEGCRTDGRHHNEYTYSKAVGEQILRESGLPILILRPSIVLSAGLLDPTFARQILWCAPLTRVFRSLPVDPAARLDVVDVGFVADAAVQLLACGTRRYDAYYLSAGRSGSLTLAELYMLIAGTYGRRSPLRLVPPARWSRAEMRESLHSPLQRRVYKSLRTYLPFLNMDVVYDDARLRADLGPAYRPPLAPVHYLPDLLRLIGTKAALTEAALP
jgi:nucleoside-diphosphate-sugar epimerase